jgi:hypothetical protein
MIDQRALALLNEVLSKTTEGKIPWEPTADEYVFIAPIRGKYTLAARPYSEIDQGTGEPRGAPSLLFKDAERDLITISTEIGADYYQLRDLYEAIKRQALKIDEKIDDALADIKNL